jgi:diacylglycerol kinase (ATP)
VRAAVLLNPTAGAADREALERLVRRRSQAKLRCPDGPEAMRGAVRRARADGAERIVVAGGDGTLHLAINALVDADGRDAGVAFGLVPCGTGDDLARTLGLPKDLEDAIDVALTARPRRLDLVRLAAGADRTFAINAVAGGFSGAVDRQLTRQAKDRWGPLAFVIGAAQTLPDIESYRTDVQIDDEPVRRVEALNVVVANGRTIGGGKQVAPPGNPSDGRLDVVIARRAPLPELAALGVKLLRGTWLEDDLVTHQRARRVRIRSEPAMWFNADGELWTDRPVEASVVPGAVEVAVPA